MILVADSGSTTTDWVLLDHEKIISSFKTSGFNPYFIQSQDIYKEVKSKTPKIFEVNEITNIYFYGSGCSSDEMNKIVYDGLKQFFTKSIIEINHDLLAAARALFMNESGIAVILGTGANTCLYNGKEIVENIPSLGFILGDEGGGDYMGKLFITDFLYGNIPEDISSKFSDKYKLSTSIILHKIYKESFPNRFLASFSEFISLHKTNSYMNNIIKKTFRKLFEIHICKYQDYENKKIRVTGSVGFHFKKQLTEVASEFNLKIDHVEKNPVLRLAQFHLLNP
ncbi:MAG: ATPase [Bacteroidales bacterium]|nr:ATPase [Bacteroidales bacterium]